jgi:SagB-type dehydrogenase family enzyme
VCYWEKDRFILHNYATGIRASATPLAVEILELCEDWRPASAFAADLRALDSTVLATVLSALVEQSLLERSDRPVPLASALYAQWNGWRPAAAFFHAATRDMRYADATSVDALLRRKSAGGNPPPSPLKRSRDAKGGSRQAIALAPPVASAATAPGDLQHALKTRRTWRQFGSAPIGGDQLATLLGMTWGVQQWMHVDGFNWMPLKTSPSGGARHSIEAYVYARRVTGLRRGWYHYDPDSHALSAVGTGAGRRPRKISAYLPTQRWYDDAAVLIAMTAIFERAQWRYGYARAYRSILAEAGHLAQTFCLLATALDLAPFCSMALADSVIERDIGVDGVSESVVYATGVGQKPDGLDWAPWPDTTRTPKLKPPTWQRAIASARPAAPQSSADRAVRTAGRARRARRG